MANIKEIMGIQNSLGKQRSSNISGISDIELED